MMKIEKAFRFAIGGVTVVDIPPGTYKVQPTMTADDVDQNVISERCAECAVEMGATKAPKGKAAKADKAETGDGGGLPLGDQGGSGDSQSSAPGGEKKPAA